MTEGGKIGGLGHIQRCLAISQAFQEKGIRPRFVINGDDSIKKVIQGEDCQIANWLKEKNKLFALAKEFDIVVMDSYLGGVDFYKRLSVLVKIPVYIDDHKRLDYPSGVILNSSICARTLNYPKRKDIRCLLGNQYACLRKAFWEVGATKVSEKIKVVMVTTGGQDPLNMMPKILKFLKAYYPALKKIVIIGGAFANKGQIKEQADRHTDFVYSPDATKMKEVMGHCDVAISAGGQTLYELARMGVPTVAFLQAPNQQFNLEGWDKEGFIEYAGNYDHYERKITQGFDKLSSKKERARRGRIGTKLVDGQGARRIREALLTYEY